MKKIYSVLLVLLSVFMLASCEKPTTNKEPHQSESHPVTGDITVSDISENSALVDINIIDKSNKVSKSTNVNTLIVSTNEIVVMKIPFTNEDNTSVDLKNLNYDTTYVLSIELIGVVEIVHTIPNKAFDTLDIQGPSVDGSITVSNIGKYNFDVDLDIIDTNNLLDTTVDAHSLFIKNVDTNHIFTEIKFSHNDNLSFNINSLIKNTNYLIYLNLESDTLFTSKINNETVKTLDSEEVPIESVTGSFQINSFDTSSVDFDLNVVDNSNLISPTDAHEIELKDAQDRLLKSIPYVIGINNYSIDNLNDNTFYKLSLVLNISDKLNHSIADVNFTTDTIVIIEDVTGTINSKNITDTTTTIIVDITDNSNVIDLNDTHSLIISSGGNVVQTISYTKGISSYLIENLLPETLYDVSLKLNNSNQLIHLVADTDFTTAAANQVFPVSGVINGTNITENSISINITISDTSNLLDPADTHEIIIKDETGTIIQRIPYLTNTSNYNLNNLIDDTNYTLSIILNKTNPLTHLVDDYDFKTLAKQPVTGSITVSNITTSSALFSIDLLDVSNTIDTTDTHVFNIKKGGTLVIATIPYVVNKTNYSVDGLSSNTDYTIVLVLNERNPLNHHIRDGKIKTEEIKPVSGSISTSNITTNSVKVLISLTDLSNTIDSSDTHSILVKKNNTVVQTIPYVLNTNSYTINSLEDNTNYTISIVLNDSSPLSHLVSDKSFKTLENIPLPTPDPITGTIEINDIHKTSVDIRIRNISDPSNSMNTSDTHAIEVHDQSDNFVTSITYITTSQWYSIDNLQPGTHYTISIVFNESNPLIHSVGDVDFTTDAVQPVSGTISTTQTDSSVTVDVRLTDSSNQIDSNDAHKLVLKDSSGNVVEEQPYNLSTSAYTFNGLKASTNYKIDIILNISNPLVHNVATKSFTTEAPTPVSGSISILSTTDITAGIYVALSDPSGLIDLNDTHSIVIKSGSTIVQNIPLDPTIKNYSVTNLLADTSYTITIILNISNPLPNTITNSFTTQSSVNSTLEVYGTLSSYDVTHEGYGVRVDLHDPNNLLSTATDVHYVTVTRVSDNRVITNIPFTYINDGSNRFDRQWKLSTGQLPNNEYRYSVTLIGTAGLVNRVMDHTFKTLEYHDVEGDINVDHITTSSFNVSFSLSDLSNQLDTTTNAQLLIVENTATNERYFKYFTYNDNVNELFENLDDDTVYHVYLYLTGPEDISHSIDYHLIKTNRLSESINVFISSSEVTQNSIKVEYLIIDNDNNLNTSGNELEVYDGSGNLVKSIAITNSTRNVEVLVDSLTLGTKYTFKTKLSTKNTGIIKNNSYTVATLDNSVKTAISDMEQYLEERSYLIAVQTDTGSYFGSGFLVDISAKYIYIGTNNHVVDAFDYSSNSLMCVGNDFDTYHNHYDIKTASNKFANTGDLGSFIHGNIITDCINAELIYNSNKYSHYDFSILRVLKTDISHNDTIQPMPIASNNSSLTNGDPLYNYSNGRGRWGSYFDDIKYVATSDSNSEKLNGVSTFIGVNTTNNAFSPNQMNPDTASYEPFATGTGSSGSAVVNKYGEIVFVASKIHSYTLNGVPIDGTWDGVNTNRNISGLNNLALNNQLINYYGLCLNESTLLFP